MADGWMLRVTHADSGNAGFREIYAWIEDKSEAIAAARRVESLSQGDRVEAVRTVSGEAFEAMGFAPGHVGEDMGTPPSGS